MGILVCVLGIGDLSQCWKQNGEALSTALPESKAILRSAGERTVRGPVPLNSYTSLTAREAVCSDGVL